MANEELIKMKIETYIKKDGTPYYSWYVGILENPEKLLFEEHFVEENGLWIYEFAPNSQAARRIVKYFLNVLGTDGEPGEEDIYAKGIYAYKKTDYTNP
jgi:hypothetical protein